MVSDQKDDRLDKAIAVFVAFATLIGVGWYSLKSSPAPQVIGPLGAQVGLASGSSEARSPAVVETPASAVLTVPVAELGASAVVVAPPVEVSRAALPVEAASGGAAAVVQAPVAAVAVVNAPEPVPVLVTPAVEASAPTTVAAVAVQASGVVSAPVVVAAAPAPLPTLEAPKVVVREHIRFASDSAVVPTSAQARLKEVAAVLKSDPRVLTIAGHTDSLGRPDRNVALSLARAEAVKAYLVEQGLAADRLKAVGLGEAHPLASNRTAKGRAQNRRIDITE